MEKSITFRNVDSIKNNLVDTILLAGTTIGLLTFLASLFPFSAENINTDFYFDIFGLGALYVTYFLRKKLSLVFKSNVIIAMLFLLFLSDVFENGLDTPDFVIVVLIPFLSILIYNFRVTISLYVISIVAYLTIGYLFQSGIIVSDYFDPTGHSFFRWLEVVLVLSVVTVMITLFLHRFNQTIYHLIENLETQKDEISQRESLLSAITENIPRSYLTLIDKDLKVIFTDGGEYRNVDLDPKQFFNQSSTDVFKQFGDEIYDKVINAYKSTLKGESQTFEIHLNGTDFLYKTVPLGNDEESIHSFLVVVENVTQIKKNQKLIEENLNEKNVLLQEIHHRVKNNLAVVSGLLSLQAFQIEDPQSKFILEKSINRILSIAKVHEMLYESKNFNKIPFDQYISELSTIILDSMNHDGDKIQFSTNVEVAYISINHGVPLGIIFNELITNSVKYGFNGSTKNRITINVSQKDDEFEVVYKDNGIGIEDFEKATSKSLGFTLIHSLMDQIEATYEYNTNNKFELRFTFPAESISNPYQISGDIT